MVRIAKMSCTSSWTCSSKLTKTGNLQRLQISASITPNKEMLRECTSIALLSPAINQ